MKRIFWLALLGILPISTALGEQQSTGEQQPTAEKQHFFEKQPLDNSQNGPFGRYFIPKWYMDAMVAANCYQTGMNNLTSDPKLAVQAFELGLQYAGKAEAEGGGASPESISRAISRELPIAEKNLKASAPTDNAGNKDSKNSDNGNSADSQPQYQSHPAAPKANMTVQSGTGLSHTGGSQGNMGRQRT